MWRLKVVGGGLASASCPDTPVYATRYHATYPDRFSVDIQLTRQLVAYRACERVELDDPESLSYIWKSYIWKSYTWSYAGAAWVVQPFYRDTMRGVLNPEQYQEAERQLQDGAIDTILAAYLRGRLDAEQFAAMFQAD